MRLSVHLKIIIKLAHSLVFSLFRVQSLITCIMLPYNTVVKTLDTRVFCFA